MEQRVTADGVCCERAFLLIVRLRGATDMMHVRLHPAASGGPNHCSQACGGLRRGSTHPGVTFQMQSAPSCYNELQCALCKQRVINHCSSLHSTAAGTSNHYHGCSTDNRGLLGLVAPGGTNSGLLTRSSFISKYASIFPSPASQQAHELSASLHADATARRQPR